MSRSFVERILIVVATVSGAILCVWWTNSLYPLMLVALVVYVSTLQRRTDHGEALQEATSEIAQQRRTRRRDDE